jgi:hypothetical protein
MYSSELTPAGGFPKQRISDYNTDIIAPPSVYNLYSDVSKLPVYEEHFEEKLQKPGEMVRVTGEPKVAEGGEGIGAIFTKSFRDRMQLMRSVAAERASSAPRHRWGWFHRVRG